MYGDDSSVMGSRRDWKGFNAPNRYSGGWLQDSHIESVDTSRQVTSTLLTESREY